MRRGVVDGCESVMRNEPATSTSLFPVLWRLASLTVAMDIVGRGPLTEIVAVAGEPSLYAGCEACASGSTSVSLICLLPENVRFCIGRMTMSAVVAPGAMVTVPDK